MSEPALFALARELRETRALIDLVKNYALTMRDLLRAGEVFVQNFPNSMPVTGPLTDAQLRASAVAASINNFPDPAYPVVAVSRAFGDLTASGDLVAAQGTGVNIRVVGGWLSATAVLSVRFLSDATDISGTIRVGTAAPFPLALNPHGWAQTGANKKLALSITGTGTLSYHVLWVPV